MQLELKGQMDSRELQLNRKDLEAYMQRKKAQNSMIPGLNSNLISVNDTGVGHGTLENLRGFKKV